MGGGYQTGAYLGHQLDVVGNLIPTIQFPISTGRFADGQQIEDLLFIHANTRCNLSQPLVGFVARFVHHADIKELGLVLEQGSTKIPELFGSDLQNRRTSLVGECGRWVPRLDMLAEDNLET